jgi:hypothetical protein
MMKYKKLLMLIVTVSVLGCQYKKGDFSVITPRNWIVVDTVDADYERFKKMHAPISSDVPVFVENINIGIMRSSNIHQYAEKVLTSIKEKAVYFKKKGSGSVSLNQYKAEWEQHVIQIDPNSEVVEQRIYFIGYKGNVYQIVCSARVNEIQNIKNEIDTVLNSFKIL